MNNTSTALTKSIINNSINREYSRADKRSKRGYTFVAPMGRLRNGSTDEEKDDDDDGKRIMLSKKYKQTLTFVDHETKTKVCLIGCVHYNPSSISLAKQITETLLLEDGLGAVVLETCEKRWTKTLEFQKIGTMRRILLDNEFQAVQELVDDQRLVSLGDQNVDELGDEMKRVFKETLGDVRTIDGWRRIKKDIDEYSKTELFPRSAKEMESLGFSDFVGDWRLLVGMSLSLFRYPLAWLLKSPKVVVPLVSFYLGIANLPQIVDSIQQIPLVDSIGDIVDQQSGSESHSISTFVDDLLSVLFFGLDIFQIVVLSRLMLVALLGKRNDILSDSIRLKCEEIQGTDRTVVAVLGAAHLNGIQNRLIS